MFRLRVWEKVPIPVFALALRTLVGLSSEPAGAGALSPAPAGKVLPVTVRLEAGIAAPGCCPLRANGEAVMLMPQPAHPAACTE